tara:strand:+ start:91019 stop:91597 length:579 start_codon:yes stop_codon:yes gene_type:complete
MDTLTEHHGLLERIAQGDQDSMSLLIDRYAGLVWSLVRRKLANSVEAEDLVQEIFAEIWKSAHRFNPELGSEATFIAVITRRRVIDVIRKITRHEPTVPFDGALEFSTVSDEPNIDTESEITSAIQVLQSLNPQRRKVIELSIIRGLSHSQIAESTNMPLGSVKAHIRRGLEEVRKLLNQKKSGSSAGEVAQ